MSRFVSGGTVDKPNERSEEWLKAQKAIEDKALQKKLEGQQQGGKSLFETLQANKAAKQDAFEESIKLKNQFRALDDDEVEFLESVNEVSRAKESAIRKETAEGLNRFREQQLKAERPVKVLEPSDDAQSNEVWSITRKRKRDKGTPGAGNVKLRRASSTGESIKVGDDNQDRAILPSAEVVASATPVDSALEGRPDTKQPVRTTSGAGLGLAAYSSDEDD